MSRRFLLPASLLAMLTLAGVQHLARMPVALPPIASIYSARVIDAECTDAMRERPPDLVWSAPQHDELAQRQRLATVNVGELREYIGRRVRVSGTLQGATGLHASRAAMIVARQYDLGLPVVPLDVHLIWPGVNPPDLPRRRTAIIARC